jgi:hypothetical protein
MAVMQRSAKHLCHFVVRRLRSVTRRDASTSGRQIKHDNYFGNEARERLRPWLDTPPALHDRQLLLSSYLWALVF